MKNEVSSLKRNELETFDSHRKKANRRKNAGIISETDVLEFELRKNNLITDIKVLNSEKMFI